MYIYSTYSCHSFQRLFDSRYIYTFLLFFNIPSKSYDLSLSLFLSPFLFFSLDDDDDDDAMLLLIDFCLITWKHLSNVSKEERFSNAGSFVGRGGKGREEGVAKASYAR